VTGLPAASTRRVLVIGLDCATPDLVFDRFLPSLPTLAGLVARGQWGRLESTIPPITVPAWASMMTGKDPGVLGIYGFRNRRDHSYDGLTTVNSRSVREPAVWDLLSARGRPSIVVGVPPSYPARAIVGCSVSCFLTPPDPTLPASHPPSLMGSLRGAFGRYHFDVDDFRTDDKARLLRDIHAMTRQRFQVFRHLVRTRPWDMAMAVDMGPDRLHHGFWKFFDPSHAKHVAGHPLASAIPEYYRLADAEIGELLREVDEETTVLVMSDHGAKRMDGGICINEWLQQQGLLTLSTPVAGIVPFARAPIDWSRTVAWGEGGYYSRIFMNVRGREPSGVVEPGDYERVRDDLAARLAAIPDEAGRPLGTAVYKPERIYREVRGIAPDLIALFGDLHWRSVGTFGHGTVWVYENDTGPDDANHAMHGLYILAGPAVRTPGRRDAHWTQIAPTLGRLLGLSAPEDGEAATLV
jgi:predicted AlkP superfamily phosphohydrolase/phosphomutase